MYWEQLLSLRRQGDTHKRLRIEQDEMRLGFEVDFDRIIFSASFRSLQDKTQVIPLSKIDFVHTRLTHSLEVSVVGRTLGRIVGQELLKKYPHLQEVHGYQAHDFGAIIAASSLAHDIGNPPFGHSGEKAIGEYFSVGKGQKFQSLLSPTQWHDLIHFEGNANGFSLVTQDRPGVEGGLRLTYATLGAFMKYPKVSLPHKPTSNISDKKYGVFQADATFFEEVATELGLPKRGAAKELRYARHPLAFLVEAADDICYTIIDFEDGINLGWISEDFALEYLIKLVRHAINVEKYNKLKTREDRISYLRAIAINALIQDAVKLFMENEEAILEGTYPFSLMDKSRYAAQMKDIIQLSVERIYRSKEVIEKEVRGHRILSLLLDVFITAINRDFEGNPTQFDQLALSLIPERYRNRKDSLYERLLQICQFVSIQTDGKVVQLYEVLR